MSFEGHDPLIPCPYDELHRIRRSRMSFHLMKCSRRHQSTVKKTATCPYDINHVVDASDFDFHVANCPAQEYAKDQSLCDETFEQEPVNRAPAPVPTKESRKAIRPSLKNWEEDNRVSCYNPWGKEKPVVRTLIGGSKTEKKRFRELERKRIQEIQERMERQEKERQEKEIREKESQEKLKERLKNEKEEEELLKKKREQELLKKKKEEEEFLKKKREQELLKKKKEEEEFFKKKREQELLKKKKEEEEFLKKKREQEEWMNRKREEQERQWQQSVPVTATEIEIHQKDVIGHAHHPDQNTSFDEEKFESLDDEVTLRRPRKKSLSLILDKFEATDLESISEILIEAEHE